MIASTARPVMKPPIPLPTAPQSACPRLQGRGRHHTAFDARVQDELDRFHIVKNVVDRLPHLGAKGDYLKQMVEDKLAAHKLFIAERGKDMPEIRDWKWGGDG